jgi:hypothetical protein
MIGFVEASPNLLRRRFNRPPTLSIPCSSRYGNNEESKSAEAFEETRIFLLKQTQEEYFKCETDNLKQFSGSISGKSSESSSNSSLSRNIYSGPLSHTFIADKISIDESLVAASTGLR